MWGGGWGGIATYTQSPPESVSPAFRWAAMRAISISVSLTAACGTKTTPQTTRPFGQVEEKGESRYNLFLQPGTKTPASRPGLHCHNHRVTDAAPLLSLEKNYFLLNQ